MVCYGRHTMHETVINPRHQWTKSTGLMETPLVMMCTIMGGRGTTRIAFFVECFGHSVNDIFHSVYLCRLFFYRGFFVECPKENTQHIIWHLVKSRIPVVGKHSTHHLTLGKEQNSGSGAQFLKSFITDTNVKYRKYKIVWAKTVSYVWASSLDRLSPLDPRSQSSSHLWSICSAPFFPTSSEPIYPDTPFLTPPHPYAQLKGKCALELFL